jgi:hypothetical protein
MNLVERIQKQQPGTRIAFLYDNLEELNACNHTDLTLIGRFACADSPKAIRKEYPIIGDIRESDYDFDTEVFGDPDYPDDVDKQGTYVSTSGVFEEGDNE